MRYLISVLLLGAGIARCLFAALAEPQSPAQQPPQQPAVATTAPTAPTAPAAPAPAALPPWQGELIELAFGTTRAMPDNPHRKTRARLQQDIVETCFALGQPTLALRYNERIDNWRRGVGVAEFAFVCARDGKPELARQHIAAADRIAEAVPDTAGAQDWYRDSIRARIAKALLVLGDQAGAARYAAGIGAADAVAFELDQADRMPRAEVDQRLPAIDRMLATGALDTVRTAMQICVRLHGRFYGDEPCRRQLAARIADHLGKVPQQIAIELRTALAGNAARNGDRTAALAMASDVEQMLLAANLDAETAIGAAAAVAVVRHRAGDEANALARLVGARDRYEQQRGSIVDIYRTETLVPLAEAFAAVGDRSAALAVYLHAAQEAVVNPNSRPRVEDLTAILCSLVRNGVEPDAALRDRLRQISHGVGDPW